jgi:hypothetical protein
MTAIIEHAATFAAAIWENWPAIAITGVGSVITGFIAQHSARRFGFLKPLAEWIGNNKAFFTVICLFVAFVWASFGAFDAERTAKDQALADKNTTRPALNPVMLYQDGYIVASVIGEKIDQATNTLFFAAVTATSELDISKMFQFRNWKLLCSGQASGSMSFGAMWQINYPNVSCRIEGAL